MLRVDFSFHYSGEGTNVCEVPEAVSEHFTSLFNCDAALLRGGELWPSFIREYREGSRTFENWLIEQSEDDWQEFMEHAGGEGTGDNGMFWGPSAPFEPQEARDWANAWMQVLQPLGDEELQRLFPLDVDPQTRQSRFDKTATMQVLGQVVAQSECAQRQGLRLTVEMALH